MFTIVNIIHDIEILKSSELAVASIAEVFVVVVLSNGWMDERV